MLVGSDGHYWPGGPSVAHEAFVQFASGLHLNEKPKIIIYNGDAFDGSKVSRHASIAWEQRPDVIDELETCQLRMKEIEDAAQDRAKLIWTIGNHDLRYETRLSSVAPEYARVHGFQLRDQFSKRWVHTWACFINSDVVVKHRFKGGIHAAHNNALLGGRSLITGHLHAQRVSAITDYNGTHYGVDTGCLAYPYGPQFVNYTESNPLTWTAGFGVFTFEDGRMLPPEVVNVWDHERGKITFRGKVIKT